MEKVEDYRFLDGCENDLKKAFYQKKSEIDFTLVYKDDVLTLEHEDQNVYCDFLSEKYLKEVRQNYSRSESVYSFLKPLSKKKRTLSVLDLTAGLGRDLFKLVLAGHKVTAFEKDPLLYLLLRDGVKRFFESEELPVLKNKFKSEDNFFCDLKYGDSFEWIKNNNQKFDLIYYDPMFEDKRKKAAPKKHMQIIKKLVDSEKYKKDEILAYSKKLSKSVVLKSSNFESQTLKPLKVINFKGFNYYIF